MPRPPKPKLSNDALRTIAREQAQLALTDAEARLLLDLVNDLRMLADAAERIVPDGLEPATLYSLGEWTND
jgi:hypothetical protein